MVPLTLPTATASLAGAGRTAAPIEVQLLSFTDFHGYLAPESAVGLGTIDTPQGRVSVGGAAYLAANVERLQKGRINSLVFSAGDAWSGWPFTTNAFADEPTIEVLNAMDLDFNVVGNHEVDDGVEDLIAKQRGACRDDREDCYLDSAGKPFAGTDFPNLSANLVDTRRNRPVMQPYTIETVCDEHGRPVRVGFIGLTTPTTTNGTTSILTDEHTVTPLLEATDRYVQQLQRQGVEAIVVVAHEGGTDSSADPNGCVDPRGPVVDYARAANPAVDVIVTGHWHAGFNCQIPDPAGQLRPVVESQEHGRLLNEIRLQIDASTGDVIRDETTSTNHLNSRDIAPDPQVQGIVERWVARGEERFLQPLATLTGDVTRDPAPTTGETLLGNLAADAYLAEGADHGAELALASPATLRTTPLRRTLTYAPSPEPADAPGRVLFGEAFDSHGYGNPVLTVSMTGAVLEQVLEQQWRAMPDGTTASHVLGLSASIRVAHDTIRPVGDRIDPADVTINGRPLEPARTYRVAALAYLLLGADGYTAATQHTDRSRGLVDKEAFTAYLGDLDEAINPAQLSGRVIAG